MIYKSNHQESKRQYEQKAKDLLMATHSLTDSEIRNWFLNHLPEGAGFLDINARPGEDAGPIWEAVWAGDTLAHLDNFQLQRAIVRHLGQLREGGLLFLSFRYGHGTGFDSGSFRNDMTEVKFKKLFKDIPAAEVLEEMITADPEGGIESPRRYNVIVRKR